MPSTFTSSTTITLFFSAWTTTSTTTYLLTLLLLFALAFLNRFLAALRFQLQHSPLHTTPGVSILAPPRSRRYRTTPKARRSPLPLYIQVDKDEEGENPPHCNEEVSGLVSARPEHHCIWVRVKNYLAAMFPKWTPSGPWSWRGDGGRALLEGMRAFIGYLL
ncbi:hypothetical protein BDW59DRAFT_162974 [Aspergillus cavernicola]|uniref:Copper transport protein n=1 Tax=Aspergillus cavernicola TaxID=176166 RepID=A0ABR4IAF2_9EURO